MFRVSTSFGGNVVGSKNRNDVGEFIDTDDRWDKREIEIRHDDIKAKCPLEFSRVCPTTTNMRLSLGIAARFQLQRSNISGLVFLFLERSDSSLGSYGRCYALASKHEQSTGVVPDLTMFLRGV